VVRLGDVSDPASLARGFGVAPGLAHGCPAKRFISQKLQSLVMTQPGACAAIRIAPEGDDFTRN